MTGDRLGDGQSIKVVNQHLCSIHIVAAAEALNLARALGLDPAAVLHLVEKGQPARGCCPTGGLAWSPAPTSR